jgi:hypothetical protein
MSGNEYLSGSSRAPIFYDSNNTGYYTDPASTSSLNALTMAGSITTPTGTSIYIGNQNVSTSSRLIINWHADSDYNYLIGKRAGAWTQPMDIAFYTGIRYHAHNAYGGHKFYTTGYDSNEAMSIGNGDNNVRVINNLYAPIFYDSNDTAYYIDPNTTATSINVRGYIRNPSIWINDGDDYNGYNENIRLFNAPNGVSVIAFSASGTSGTPTTSILGYSSYMERRVSDGWQERMYSGYLEASGSYRAPIFYDSNNTGYYADLNGTTYCYYLQSATSLRADSDRRIKDNIKTIDNAIDKVKRLRGTYFTRKDLADKTKKHVGLIAQEVLEVIPEVVGGSEDSTYSVGYGEIVAVLIEAIKEQQEQIEEMRNLINGK